jgi:hypothetical protein
MNNNEIICKDAMWYKLGCDFCKLKEYCLIIFLKILINHFGKNHKLSKHFDIMIKRHFINIASTLDSIINADYDKNINTLEKIPCNPNICSVFYSLYSSALNSSTQITYNEKLDGSGNNIVFHFTPIPIKRIYDKKITLEEKRFIDVFFENLNEYLVNIEFLLHYDTNYKNELNNRIVDIKKYMIKLQQEINEIYVV